MFLSLLRIPMKWIEFILPGIMVWLTQLLLVDFLSINTVRPDFLIILVLYWSIKHGKSVGTLSGFIIGLSVDLSGTASFFGLSPLIYTITGYLGGYLHGSYLKLNPIYFTLAWVGIISLHFLIFSVVQYQEIWNVNPSLFWMKWIATTLYTLSFTGILQVIYPMHKLV